MCARRMGGELALAKTGLASGVFVVDAAAGMKCGKVRVTGRALLAEAM